MAYFGNRPDKPGSVPGSQSGFVQERQEAHRRAVRGRVERRLKNGRAERGGRGARTLRAAR